MFLVLIRKKYSKLKLGNISAYISTNNYQNYLRNFDNSPIIKGETSLSYQGITDLYVRQGLTKWWCGH